MKRRIIVYEKELYKNIWISFAIFKDENGTEDYFKFEKDFIYTFGKTDKEAKEELKKLLLKREDVFDTDIEAFF